MWNDAPRRFLSPTTTMIPSSEVGYFDPDEALEQTQRNLPHWFQPNVATFITFRTSDSMPRDVVRRWTGELAEWLRKHGVTLTRDDLPVVSALPSALQPEYAKHRNAAGTGISIPAMENASCGNENWQRSSWSHCNTSMGIDTISIAPS